MSKNAGKPWASARAHAAPTASGQRTQKARLNDEQPGKHGLLNSDTPHGGRRRPPPLETPCDHPSAQHQLARAWSVGSVKGPPIRTPHAKNTRATHPSCMPQGQTLWEGKCLNTRTPTKARESPPSGKLLPAPRAAMSETACGPTGRSRAPMPASHTHSQWAAKPTAWPRDGQPGEAECLNSDTLNQGKRRLPRHPPATPTARVSAHRSMCCRVGDRPPHPQTPRPRDKGSRPSRKGKGLNTGRPRPG